MLIPSSAEHCWRQVIPDPASKFRSSGPTRVPGSMLQGNAYSSVLFLFPQSPVPQPPPPGKPSLITYGSYYSPFGQFSVPLLACPAPQHQAFLEAPGSCC